MGYVINHLATVAGTALAAYFLWSMILDPAGGPLPGTVLPLAVGVAGFAGAVFLAAWGARLIYGRSSPGGNARR